MSHLFTFDFFKWFYPGMHIKRWLGLIIIGVAIMTFGLSYVVREAYLEGLRLPGFMYWVTLQFIPRYIRGVMFMSGAVSLILFSIWKLNQSIISVLAPHRELGVRPPGDVRNCIAALADAEPLVTKLFQYRFEDGEGLAGHSFGNLFIVAMSGVTGNMEGAIRQTSRGLAVRGQIIPSTMEDVTLCARTDDARTIRGESSIGPAVNGGGARIREVYLAPENPAAPPEAVRAILEADLIVLGPGT